MENNVTLAIFDLDNTLLNGDSDHAWGEFMCQKGLVDVDSYREGNDEFHRQYDQGCMNIYEYLEFALAALAAHPKAELDQWHKVFMDEVIIPIILPQGVELVKKHRDAGHHLMMITATNRFVTGPIAEYLGMDTLIATDAEMKDGEFTGKVEGLPSYQDGKVTRLQQWVEENGESFEGSYFYSDSQNDLPLLKQVSYPYAVNPDATLTEYANTHGWPILDLRQ